VSQYRSMRIDNCNKPPSSLRYCLLFLCLTTLIMDSEPKISDPWPYQEELASIRSLGYIHAFARMQFLPFTLVPWDFLLTLEIPIRLVAFQFCLSCWLVTQCQVPREVQLKSALSVYFKDSTLLVAGTGFGKTLVVILLLLVQEPGRSTIMISPFKRLQLTQVRKYFLWLRISKYSNI
jgi:hypothetical protein